MGCEELALMVEEGSGSQEWGEGKEMDSPILQKGLQSC